jgi:two-component system, NarL family, sensor kinase
MSDRRSQELSILNDVARALNASVDLPALLACALEKVAELLGLRTGWVLLFDEASGAPTLAAAQNLPPGLRQEPELMTGSCQCLDSFCTGELDGAANIGVVSCSRLRKLGLAKGKTAGLRYHASVPLTVFEGPPPVAGGDAERSRGLKRLGMLNVAGPKWRQLDAGELNLLRTIGDMLGVAVERARLHARRLEAAQVEERNRLAREIHDTLAQDLSAVAYQIEAAEALLTQQAEPERIRRCLTAALDLTRKGLEEARRSVLDLRAAPLEGRSLPAALAALAEEVVSVEPARAPAVAFEAEPSAVSLPPAVEVGLYRIAQEALQNALRHASAARVLLRLETSAEQARLTVQDDGRGFAFEGGAGATTAARSGRFGLIGMRERARLLGGSFQVASSPGAGTRVTAEVPLAAGLPPDL